MEDRRLDRRMSENLDQWTMAERLDTKSLIIPLPKKGNTRLCQNYRTISLICRPSKVILRVILNRLVNQAEQFLEEEQAGFTSEGSNTEQIFNLRLLVE